MSRPPDSPLSRRAARALREEARGRALESEPSAPPEPPTATLPLPIIPAAAGASRPAPLPTRHDARAAQLLSTGVAPARHARAPRATRAGVAIGLAAAAALLLGSSAAMTAMMMEPTSTDDGGRTYAAARFAPPPLPSVEALPVPKVAQTLATEDICTLPEVADALAAGDDEGVISAAGGGEGFRAAVVSGNAPCLSLADPARIWVVVNKTRPYDPLQYQPDLLVTPDNVRNIEGGTLRPDAASALTGMAAAASQAGAGEIAVESGFRSYTTQNSSYGSQVSDRGIAGADLVSARPGYSEHQSGITADIVACNGGCGTLDDLAASPQGAWIAAHAWEYGWIVRYEDGHTDTTGYLAEPWHLRYVGPQLAQAYHDGGWHTLEEFFGLPAAPGYPG